MFSTLCKRLQMAPKATVIMEMLVYDSRQVGDIMMSRPKVLEVEGMRVLVLKFEG
jgi:hypothetical protein